MINLRLLVRPVLQLVRFCLIVLVAGLGCESQTPHRKVRLNPPADQVSSERERPERVLRLVVAPIMSPAETARIYSELMNYLEKKLGRPVQLIQGSTYTEINEFIRTGGCDVSFVCSYAYLVGQRDFGMQALVIPQRHGDVRYYSYIIVPADSAAQDWRDLRNKVFAFSDPLSNTGYLAPRYLLMTNGEDFQQFFKESIFTYSHDNSIRAVADKLVDGAAVDHRVLEHVVSAQPEMEKRIRIIHRSQAFGIPPVVVPPAIEPGLKKALQEAFLTMNEDPLGKAALRRLLVERFVLPDDRLYDTTRQMMAKLQEKP